MGRLVVLAPVPDLGRGEGGPAKTGPTQAWGGGQSA